MLKRFDALLDQLAVSPFDLTPRRFGLVTACDGGLLEVSGLSVPIGALCRIDDGKGSSLTAEVIGFRNGRTMMMMLGDSVLLRPGARVRAEGRPGMLPVGPAWLGRAGGGAGKPVGGGRPVDPEAGGPAGGVRTGARDRASVTVPSHTGIRAINALTTLGVGQR